MTWEYQREPDTNTTIPQPEQWRLKDTNQMNSDIKPGIIEKGESSNTRKVYGYYCWKEGQYSSQCPVKTNEKQPAVNMVIAEVADIQQVTTRSKGKTAKWESQVVIRKEVTKWIQKANEQNTAEVRK